MLNVDVIIPVQKRIFIIEAIESVIHQTHQNINIIIIDGSADDAKNIVHRFCNLYPCKINYYYQHQQGPAVARNTGIKKSSNEYIAFLYVAQKAGYKTFYTSAYHTKNFKTVPFYLIIINYAAFVGLLKYLFRTQKVTWEKPQ